MKNKKVKAHQNDVFFCIEKQNGNTKETTAMLYYSIDKSRRRTLALLTQS